MTETTQSLPFGEPVTFNLDLEKWRCGGNSTFSLGSGGTMLVDPGVSKHNQCCVGQMAIQCGFTEKALSNWGTWAVPHGDIMLSQIRATPMQEAFDKFMEAHAKTFYAINDSELTTVRHKVAQLQAELAKHSITLIPINGDDWDIGEDFDTPLSHWEAANV